MLGAVENVQNLYKNLSGRGFAANFNRNLIRLRVGNEAIRALTAAGELVGDRKYILSSSCVSARCILGLIRLSIKATPRKSQADHVATWRAVNRDIIVG